MTTNQIERRFQRRNADLLITRLTGGQDNEMAALIAVGTMTLVMALLFLALCGG